MEPEDQTYFETKSSIVSISLISNQYAINWLFEMKNPRRKIGTI